ncbi:MAG: ArsR family transcriptional regulator [Promethearchaeota archaeon]|nr:MAG: ArsR family transcriptional regulator [Candidatus Lokiarchaeota archaeon]
MVTYKCYHEHRYSTMNEKLIEADKPEIGIKTVSKALGSHLRTEILSQLASGDKYVLQLVKTIGKSQQDIHRNLNYLESLGIVKSYVLGYEDYRKKHTKPSKGRRYFTIDHAFMLHINLAPNLFDQKYNTIPLEHVKYDKKIRYNNKSLNLDNIQRKNLSELSNELEGLNNEIEELEDQQKAIFIKQSQIRNQIVELINQIDLSPLQLVVLEKILGKSPVKIEDLAEELNFNPNHLQSIMESLQLLVQLKHTNGYWSI